MFKSLKKKPASIKQVNVKKKQEESQEMDIN
jgi:hypothetical protein